MRKIALPLIFTFAAACGSDAPTQPSLSTEGTWSLQTINGSALPYNLGTSSTGAKLEVVKEDLVIANGTYTVTTLIRATLNGTATTDTDVDAGTVAQNGSAVTFKSTADATVANGTLSPGKLTITQENTTLVFTTAAGSR